METIRLKIVEDGDHQFEDSGRVETISLRIVEGWRPSV